MQKDINATSSVALDSSTSKEYSCTKNQSSHENASSVKSERILIKPDKHDLNDRDRKEMITKRGLDEDFVRVNCRSASRLEAAEHLHIKNAPSSGIILEGANGHGQFRPVKQWNDPEKPKDRGRKYVSRYQEEYDIMLPIHPEDRDYWEKQNYEELKTKCYQIDGEPTLVLTEGLPKAIAGMMHDIPTIALKGVEQGLTPKSADPQEKRYLVPGLEEFCRANFGITIAFDADLETNPNVKRALYVLGRQLLKFGTKVYVCGKWDESDGKGMDDFIQKNGIEAFRQKLAKSVVFHNWVTDYEEEVRVEKEQKNKGTQASCADEIQSNYGELIKWHTGNKAWYQYEAEKNGMWSEITEEDICAICEEEARRQRDRRFGYNLVSGIKKMLKYRFRENKLEVKRGFVCLEDCVLDINTLQEFPHEAGYKFLTQLPYKWSDRKNGCQPILDFLLQANQGHSDRVQLIRAGMKATLTRQGSRFQRFIEMWGAGGSGKGTILRLVAKLCGEDSIKSTDLKNLETNRFENSTLYGKLALIIGDAEQYTGDVSNFKSITGGDYLRNEEKGKQQRKPFQFDGMPWVGANGPITSNEYTSGLRRRRISLFFPNSIPLEDQRNLEEEFEPYIPGLLQWVMEMPDEEMAEYLHKTELKVPSLQQDSIDTLVETNPMAAWLQDNLILTPGAKTHIGTKTKDASRNLYHNNVEWLQETNRTPLNLNNFSRVLLDLLKNQLRVPNVRKAKNSTGMFISEIAIRHPGDIGIPDPLQTLTKKGKVKTSEESQTGNDRRNEDLVNSETLTTKGKVINSEDSEGCFRDEKFDLLHDDISLCDIVNKEEIKDAGSHNLHSPVTEPITAENPQYSQGFTVKGDNSTSPPVEESSNPLPVRENYTSSHVEEQSTTSPVEDNFTHSPVEENFKPSPIKEDSTPSPVEEHFTPSPIKENSIVYPTSGKLEGKECIVGTIQANGTYWVRRNNNQPANSPIAYTRDQLSTTSPKSETSSEEVISTQPDLFDNNQAYGIAEGDSFLEAVDD